MDNLITVIVEYKLKIGTETFVFTKSELLDLKKSIDNVLGNVNNDKNLEDFQSQKYSKNPYFQDQIYQSIPLV